MRVSIVAAGRLRDPALETLIDRYLERLRWPVEIVEIVPRGKRVGADAETELVLARVPAGAKLVVLDERGRDLSSRELAEQISTWRDLAVDEIVFAIGGADGLAPHGP